MALALNNLKRVDMPLNKETKPNQLLWQSKGDAIPWNNHCFKIFLLTLKKSISLISIVFCILTDMISFFSLFLCPIIWVLNTLPVSFVYPLEIGVLDITLKCIWWCSSSFRSLKNMESLVHCHYSLVHSGCGC